MSQADRMGALEWAADYAQRNKLFELPTNSRGYTADGVKPITPQEKAAIVIRLADWIMQTDSKEDS